MVRDFTLVIPTYNRPASLGRLLRFLNSTGCNHPVLVLDSSHPAEREENRYIAASTGLSLEHFFEYPVETHPFDKFRDGIDRVTTPFCALCADDDLVLPAGSRACVDALRSDSEVAVAQGYSLMFLEHPHGRFDLVNVLYFADGILDRQPLARLLRQFEQYQATTYGHYRTEALRSIFHRVKPLKSILARELLSSALSVVSGKVVRLPQFSNARSMGPSASYDFWHPLEWFAKDAPGLLMEYQGYRAILVEAIMARGDNPQSEAETQRVVDLIHLIYMARHAPPEAVRFMVEQELAKVPFAQYWPDHAIQIPLIHASGVGVPRASGILKSLSRFLAPRRTVRSPGGGLSADAVIERDGRQFFLHKAFTDFCTENFAEHAAGVAAGLCDVLRHYGSAADGRVMA